MNVVFRQIESARRRRIGFRFSSDGVLEVRTPCGVSGKTVETLILRHRDVIERLRARVLSSAPPEIGEGVQFFFRGKTYPVRLTRRLAFFDDAFLIPDGDRAEKLAALTRVYRKLAAEFVLPRAALLAEKHGVAVKKLSVSSAAGRYGSCSASGNCSFSWHLVQFPDEMIDYVICHELAHRFEMNHSPRFYAVLEKFFPGAALMRKNMRVFASEHKLF